MRSWWYTLRREMRVSARLLLLSVLAMAWIAYLMASNYPSFHERIAAASHHGPRIVRRIIEGRAAPEGFLAFTFFHPVAFVLFATWPVTRASQAIAGAIDRGNMGWRMALPLSRSAYFWAQVIWMLAGSALLSAALVAGLAYGCWRYDVAVAGWPRYGLAAVGETFRYAAVGALTLWASAAASRAALPAMLGAGLVIGSAILENVGGPLELLAGYQWLSLFHYAQARPILETGLLPTHDVLVLGAVMIVGLLGAWATFLWRDLNI